MAYIKKTWVNVPDPSNPPSIPEGQDALTRFDAENMNRIEDGIEEAFKAVDALTADDVGAVGLGDDIVVGNATRNTTEGGIRFGIMYSEIGVPMVGVGTQTGSNSLLLASGCDYTSSEKQAEFGKSGYYFPVELPESSISYPCALKISNYDGKVYFSRSTNKKKHYTKNEIIPMSEHEVLHTGNKDLITPNDIMALSIGGGTAVNKNDDLNSYITSGNYICPFTETSLTLANCPVGVAFVMTVGYAAGKPSYMYQELRAFNTGVKYYRTCTTDTEVWSEWIESYNTANKPTPGDIGAAQITCGSYIGTGTSGSNNPNTVTADFDIKIALIRQDDGANTIMALKGESTSFYFAGENLRSVEVLWGNNCLSWYSANTSNGAFMQFNESGKTYRYILIG